ncbi:MAG: FAD/FMN-containing dehydrogenase [Verrucomicrobiales bacterium]|jgi:glycolate oxidase subunit GlcD|nr:FAD/FMN-containing dehydrogenase [Verrucomicrobiales bacterium]|tara:strand:- start:6572 stop:7987 length:1416 start_codon:yes stop_codon:yes gene_type:complete
MGLVNEINRELSSPAWLAGLEAVLDPERISVAAETLADFGTDRWHASAKPEAVVQALSRDDVVATMKFANKNGIPVTTRGSGVGYVGGCVPVSGGILLSVKKMNRILEVNSGDGVAVVEPGVILNDLQEMVRECGCYYPPDPASLKECSVGGTIATNAGGPRCVKYGVTRHYILGLEVVLPTGEVLETGGRCHKNKTGLDLIGMFVGSEGLLGVITKATLRLIPHPEARAMLTAVFPEFEAAAVAVQTILNSGWQPSGLEITDGFTLSAARDRLGSEVLPAGDAHLIVELDGRQDSVLNDLAHLRELIESLGANSVEEARDKESCEAIWNLRREFSYSLRDTGLIKLNEDVVVPRSKLVELVQFARKLELETGIPVACFGHAGDGNIHTNLMVKDYDIDDAAREKADAALDILFKWIIENDGQITGEHGVGLAKKRWFKDAVSPISQNVHRQLKATLDPKGILNPGKFIES